MNPIAYPIIIFGGIAICICLGVFLGYQWGNMRKQVGNKEYDAAMEYLQYLKSEEHIEDVTMGLEYAVRIAAGLAQLPDRVHQKRTRRKLEQ